MDINIELKEIYAKIEEAEEDIKANRVGDAKEGVQMLREKYGINKDEDK